MSCEGTCSTCGDLCADTERDERIAERDALRAEVEQLRAQVGAAVAEVNDLNRQANAYHNVRREVLLHEDSEQRRRARLDPVLEGERREVVDKLKAAFADAGVRGMQVDGEDADERAAIVGFLRRWFERPAYAGDHAWMLAGTREALAAIERDEHQAAAGSSTATSSPTADAPNAGPLCSFCGKTRREVAKLVARHGEPKVYICDECISLYLGLLASDGDRDITTTNAGRDR